MERLKILYIGITEYMNMSVCISARSLCLRLIVVAMAGFALHCVFSFFWVFTSHSPPQSSSSSSNKRKKKKKKAVRRNKNSPINSNYDVLLNDNLHENGTSQVNDNSHENDTSHENGNSQPKDTKDASVKSIRLFTYKTLLNVTQDFHLKQRLHVDSLGPVYKGTIINEVLAIREINSPFQNLEDFVAEVLLLSQANHPNLAKLIGYCIERYHNRSLVYKYESGGSLQNHLHGNQSWLDWKLRMKIALGVAKAVEYLQNDMKPPILHCYIEPSNVWLDENMSPKLSAFGVIRMYPPCNKSGGCFETIGSYLYGLHDKDLVNEVTKETDIRGFGIFLLELVTGIKGRFNSKDGVRRNLADWVRPYLEGEKNLASMVDAKLDGKFDIGELREVCNLAGACIEKQPSHRPRISDVVKRMEELVNSSLYDLYDSDQLM